MLLDIFTAPWKEIISALQLTVDSDMLCEAAWANLPNESKPVWPEDRVDEDAKDVLAKYGHLAPQKHTRSELAKGNYQDRARDVLARNFDIVRRDQRQYQELSDSRFSVSCAWKLLC